eukprot:194429_1
MEHKDAITHTDQSLEDSMDTSTNKTTLKHVAAKIEWMHYLQKDGYVSYDQLVSMALKIEVDEYYVRSKCQLILKETRIKRNVRQKKDKLRKELYDLCNSYGSRKVFKQVSKHSKVRDEEFIKFVVDMQSGNQTFEAHPRRSKCVLLMEIISKRDGKVNYDRYYAYHILFVSIREYYARQKLLDIVPGYLRRSGLVDLDCMNLIMAFYDKRDIMNKVSSDKVIQTINESDADIDRMIAVAQFDNSYTVTNTRIGSEIVKANRNTLSGYL